MSLVYLSEDRLLWCPHGFILITRDMHIIPLKSFETSSLTVYKGQVLACLQDFVIH